MDEAFISDIQAVVWIVNRPNKKGQWCCCKTPVKKGKKVAGAGNNSIREAEYQRVQNTEEGKQKHQLGTSRMVLKHLPCLVVNRVEQAIIKIQLLKSGYYKENKILPQEWSLG